MARTLQGETETYVIPASIVRMECAYLKSQGGVIVGKPWPIGDGNRAVRVFWRD
jgi:hypothetical protein